MLYESVETKIQKLSAQLLPGKEFFGVAFGKKGGPIRLIGPFEILRRRGELVVFIDVDENWENPENVEVTVTDLVLTFDKVVPIRPRHNGTPQEIDYIDIRVMKEE